MNLRQKLAAAVAGLATSAGAASAQQEAPTAPEQSVQENAPDLDDGSSLVLANDNAQETSFNTNLSFAPIYNVPGNSFEDTLMYDFGLTHREPVGDDQAFEMTFGVLGFNGGGDIIGLGDTSLSLLNFDGNRTDRFSLNYSPLNVPRGTMFVHQNDLSALGGMYGNVFNATSPGETLGLDYSAAFENGKTTTTLNAGIFTGVGIRDSDVFDDITRTNADLNFGAEIGASRFIKLDEDTLLSMGATGRYLNWGGETDRSTSTITSIYDLPIGSDPNDPDDVLVNGGVPSVDPDTGEFIFVDQWQTTDTFTSIIGAEDEYQLVGALRLDRQVNERLYLSAGATGGYVLNHLGDGKNDGFFVSLDAHAMKRLNEHFSLVGGAGIHYNDVFHSSPDATFARIMGGLNWEIPNSNANAVIGVMHDIDVHNADGNTGLFAGFRFDF